MSISPSVLRSLCPHVPEEAADRWANALSIAADGAGIRSRKHFVMWIGLGLTTSDKLTHIDERLNLDARQLSIFRPDLYAAHPEAPELGPSRIALDIANDPQQIASHLYAHVNGNGAAHTGDGYRFRPRFPNRLLGRDLYTKARHDLNFPSLTGNPDLLLNNFAAQARICAWYWYERKVWKEDVDDFRAALQVWCGVQFVPFPDEDQDPAHDERALYWREIKGALE